MVGLTRLLGCSLFVETGTVSPKCTFFICHGCVRMSRTFDCSICVHSAYTNLIANLPTDKRMDDLSQFKFTRTYK